MKHLTNISAASALKFFDADLLRFSVGRGIYLILEILKLKAVIMKTLLSLILLITISTFSNKIYSQTAAPDASITAFTRFEGNWKLKDDIWKTKSGGTLKESVDTSRAFVVKMVRPNTLLWDAYFGNGSWVTLLWTYHSKTGRVNQISNAKDNTVGVGTGEFNATGDLVIKVAYPNGCTTCHRIETWHWISANEFEFNSASYKDDKPTGDFYGGTFLRK